MTKIAATQLLQKHKELFPNAQDRKIVWAPGRVNLLGEHTDYNDGFVLPMAINSGIMMVGAFNNSSSVNVYSMDFAVKTSFSLTKITHSQEHAWTNYLRGVFDQLQKLGKEPKGMDLVLQGNVPQGAGLSSSAALEIATALLVTEIHGWQIEPVELVKLAQRVENEFVGVASGIMDQFASMLGAKDKALFLDCRSLDYELIPTPFEEQGYAVVVINSGVKRGLVDSEYNTRRQQCEQAVEELKPHIPEITALRDATIEHLPLINQLPEVIAKRARHVVTENQRVLSAVQELQKGNLVKFGSLLNDSHQSLRDDFDVSCPELDILVDLAQNFPGVLGSRMTGAGFGGCTVSLVDQTKLPLFKEHILTEYERQTNIKPEFYVFQASPGAHIKTEEPPQS